MSRIRRYQYNFSHETACAGQLNALVPIDCMFVNPGETLKGTMGTHMRVLPLVIPKLNKFYLHTYWFYVPIRALWDQWEQFIVNNYKTDTSENLVPPQVDGQVGLLQDPSQKYDAFPLRAYNMVWNLFFRDVRMDKRDKDAVLADPNSIGDFAPCCYPKDYSTTLWESDYENQNLQSGLKLTGVKGSFDSNALFVNDAIAARDGYTSGNPNATTEFTNLNLEAEEGQAFIRKDWLQHDAEVDRREFISHVYGDKSYFDVMRHMGGMVRREVVPQPELLYKSRRLCPLVDNHGTAGNNLGEVKATIHSYKKERFPARVFKEHGIVIGLQSLRVTPWNDCIFTPEQKLDQTDLGDQIWIGQNTVSARALWVRSQDKPNAGQPVWKYFHDRAYTFSLEHFRKPMHRTQHTYAKGSNQWNNMVWFLPDYQNWEAAVNPYKNVWKWDKDQGKTGAFVVDQTNSAKGWNNAFSNELFPGSPVTGVDGKLWYTYHLHNHINVKRISPIAPAAKLIKKFNASYL